MSAVNASGRAEAEAGPTALVSVPEIRDYAKINAELAVLLDAGHRHVRLSGVDGQRLLVRGLLGAWQAVVEIEGNAGPELAADLDAPGLLVICTGSALDGAGRGLLQGRLLILGSAGNAVGATQSGGTIVVVGSCANRLGLRQSGGVLVAGGEVGRLASERQSGGCVIATRGPIGPFVGYGRSGGRFVKPTEMGAEDLAILEDEAAAFGSWWPSTLLPPPTAR